MLLTPLLPARTLQVPINHLINQTSFHEINEKLNKNNSNNNINNNSIDGSRLYHLLNNIKISPTNQLDKTTKLSLNNIMLNASEIDNLIIEQRIKKSFSNKSSSVEEETYSSSSASGINNNTINNYSNLNNNYSVNLDSDRYNNKKQRSDLYLVRTNFEKNISYEKTSINSKKAYSKNTNQVDGGIDGKQLQITFYDILFASIVFSLIGVLILSLIGVVRCLRATSDSSRALALPTTVLSEDRTPLNTESHNTVPMLSVQTPGCAGMERLGIPARSSFGSPSVRDNRGHSCRLRSESTVLQSCDISTIPSNRQVKSYQDINHHHSNIQVMSCPHHVPLADGEWGPDRDLQIRTPYQQTEITRTYIKAPPNKTAFDIPEQSYNLFSSTSSCNLNSHRSLNSINMSNTSSNISISPATSAGTNQKSKANAITKFLLRISSNSKSSDNQNQHAMGTNQLHCNNHQQQQLQQHHNHHHHHHQQQQHQHYQNYQIKNNSNNSLNTSINSVVVQQHQQQQQPQHGYGLNNQIINNNNHNNNNNNNSDTNSNNSYSHQQTDS